MKNIIIDFKKLTPEILALVVEKFPDGYEDSDIIKFKNINNQTIEALEIVTNDTKYLVKINHKLATAIEAYDEDEYFDIDDISINKTFKPE